MNAEKSLKQFAASMHGLFIVKDPKLEPNEVRVHVGEEMYERIKRYACKDD